jgi:DNA helicase II / ATP-dependent DNA helicase PcrA
MNSSNLQPFNTFLEKELNKNQLQAVKERNGAFLVIAGAGSGKTRVITARITNLIINHNVKPYEIIALTFTNKAAREMKERIQTFLPDQANLPFIGTFHSFCLLHIKKFKSYHSIENFSILDSEDQLKLIRLILNKFALNKDYNAKHVQYQISILKNNNLLDNASESVQDKRMLEILNEYEKEKKNNRCLDFDDLLIEVVKLFKNNKAFKESFQNNIRHLLVDEYQDTNAIQHELLKEIALKFENTPNSKKTIKSHILDSICAVGDEDQSIYSWRGAIVENINHFKNDFPNTKLIKIEQNYRSINQILDIANCVIKNNTNRTEKKLWSEKKGQNRVLRTTSFSGTKEAELVAKYVTMTQVKSLETKKDPKPSIAILYRTHFQSRLIEEALLKKAINYKIIGGIQFYERKEVKDILAYLKLIVNPFDKISFFRIINCPTRGIGKKSEELIMQKWNSEPLLNFKEIIKTISNEKDLPATKIKALIDFCNLFSKFNESDNAVYVIKELIDNLEYVFYLKSEFDKTDAESRIENLNELIRAADYKALNIKDFLDEVALLQDQLNNNDEKNIQVQLMTLHAAKGLEFDHVLIVGLEEGLLPSNRSLENQESIEEERRLFYVGITRAKEYLVICNAQFRNTYGQTGTQISSRFIDEIPNHKIHSFHHTNYNDYELENLLTQFLEIKLDIKFKPSILTFETETPIKQDLPHNKDTIQPNKNILEKWKKNHFAKHKKFGVGLIKEIEKKPETTILTLQFKNFGIKKIDSKFLEKI